MGQKIEWLEGNRIKVSPPRKPKKITGTRLAAILGLNPWATPFATWCEITKTYQQPFADTKYTQFGKVVEPRQADYMEKFYGMSLIRPTDVYGPDPFKQTYGDFFQSQHIFGGMWDYLETDDDRSVVTVLEMKTSSRPQDWQDEPPVYYTIQSALYAYLMHVENCVMVCTFPDEKDYDNPEEFKVKTDNTITFPFEVHKYFPQFDAMIDQAEQWWNDYVLTGISPPFDEKRDAQILKELRTNKDEVSKDEIKKLLHLGDELKVRIDEAKSAIEDDEKTLKAIYAQIKSYAQEQMEEGQNKVILSSGHYDWSLTKSSKQELDTGKLKEDGIYDKYLKTEDTFRFQVTERKDENGTHSAQ